VAVSPKGGDARLAVKELIAAVEHKVLLPPIDYPPPLYATAREGPAMESKLRRQAAFEIGGGDLSIGGCFRGARTRPYLRDD
jgi:hypothetical protein